MVRQFHDGMKANVFDDGESSGSFLVTDGVKQGCVLAPTLFSMMFYSDPGIDIRYRTDGKFFNLRRLQAKTKINVDRL